MSKTVALFALLLLSAAFAARRPANHRKSSWSSATIASFPPSSPCRPTPRSS